MSGGQITEAAFLKDVAEHQMTVVRNDGVHRHLKFNKPGTWCYGFNIITWPGSLCIDGDMGTYVFRRLEDMFEFFRTDRAHGRPGQQLYINPGYWAEKCVSDSKYIGLQEFNDDKFRACVVEEYRQWRESNRSEHTAEMRRDLRQRLRDEVLSRLDEGEHAAITAAIEFSDHDLRFRMDCFYEHDLRSYTFHFIWCLFAIAWAVKLYDAQRTMVTA